MLSETAIKTKAAKVLAAIAKTENQRILQINTELVGIIVRSIIYECARVDTSIGNRELFNALFCAV